jgi:hypothetical protein
VIFFPGNVSSHVPPVDDPPLSQSTVMDPAPPTESVIVPV